MKRRRPSRTVALHGERVALRPMRQGDREALAGWHEVADAKSGSKVLVMMRAGENEPLGVVEYRVDGRRKALLVEYVGVSPELRGFGLGSEAVRVFEEDAFGRGRAWRLEAEVGLEEGLALYFWLRLGCRPFVWPSESRQGKIVLTREMGAKA